MPLSEKENFLRAVDFRGPEWIPIAFELRLALWLRHGQALEDLLLRHPLVFPRYRKGTRHDDPGDPFARDNGYFRDTWGCLWHNTTAGALGQVIEHPLADWAALAGYRPPDPARHVDLEALREGARRARQEGRLVTGGYNFLQGGFFDRLQFLRGLESLLLDFATEPPELARLIEMVLDYNLKNIRLRLEAGPEMFYFHGDIGTQHGPMFSPAAFRKYLKPAYREMFSLCRRAGARVYYSSDGRLLDLVDDLLDCGVSLHDPQLGPQSLAELARVYKGRLCAQVDIDEQRLPFWTPAEVREQIRLVVEQMNDPRGGLIIFAGPSEEVPLANIEALCAAWEEFRYGKTER